MIGFGKIRGSILLISAGLFVILALQGGRISAQELIDTTDEKSKVKFLISVFDDEDEQPSVSFTIGEQIHIRAIIVNNSTENYPHVIIDNYYHFHLILQKVGKRSVQKFRADKIETISRREQEPTSFARMVAAPINPGDLRLIGSFNLIDWYESLEPGEYRLTIQYRSHPGKPVLQSNTLVFEIVP